MEYRFRELGELGRKEHWLLRSDENKILEPQSCLGEGGFGVVLAALEAVLEAILAVWRPNRAPRSNFRGADFQGTHAMRGGSALEHT